MRVSAAPRAGRDPSWELRVHLRALASYFTTANHPFCEARRAAVLTHDFTHELRIARDFILSCSTLVGHNAKPSAEARFSSGVFGGDAGASPLEGAGVLPPSEDSSEDALSAALGDLHMLCEGLLEAPGVSFQAWSGLTRVALRQLNQTASGLLADDASERQPSVPHDLHALTAQISPDALSADVSLIFTRLFGMLEVSKLIEAALAADEPLKQTLPFFSWLRGETRRLLDLLVERTLHIEGLDPAVHEYLDGVGYAIRMELRKAFEHELVGLASLRHPPQVFGRVENAHGLLRDCFQQSVISVARAFDPQFDGLGLFNNFRTKLEQSLLLRRELWDVLAAMRRAGEAPGQTAPRELLDRLNDFRDGSLRFLMYKDWEAFERFVEEVTAAKSSSELHPVLHRFQAFLETLFGQVSMRAVLADHPFTPPEQ